MTQKANTRTVFNCLNVSEVCKDIFSATITDFPDEGDDGRARLDIGLDGGETTRTMWFVGTNRIYNAKVYFSLNYRPPMSEVRRQLRWVQETRQVFKPSTYDNPVVVPAPNEPWTKGAHGTGRYSVKVVDATPPPQPSPSSEPLRISLSTFLRTLADIVEQEEKH